MAGLLQLTAGVAVDTPTVRLDAAQVASRLAAAGETGVPDLAHCERLPFAATLPVPEASGAVWLSRDGGVIMVIGDSGHDGAYVIVDEKPTAIPPETNLLFSFDNVAHENPRRRQALQQMMRDFWRTGTATNTCTGACDCASGNCGTLRGPTHGGS